MSWLTLTPENFRTGELTKEQIAGAAGFRVETLSLSSAPHWGLIKANKHLSPAELWERFPNQLVERSRNFYAQLKRLGMTVKYGGHYTYDDAMQMAVAKGPIVQCTADLVSAPDGLHDYFRAVQRDGVDVTVDNVRTAAFSTKYKPQWIMPYVYYGTLSEEIPVECVRKKTAAVILKNGKDDIVEVWARVLGLPVERVRCFPKDRIPDANIYNLEGQIHEEGHLPQINVDSTIDLKKIAPEERNKREDLMGTHNHISMYYEEAQTNLVKCSVLRRADCGYDQETSHMIFLDRHRLYMGMFFNEPKNWHAPLLDALEQKTEPYNFYQVHQAVMEIRLRLVAEADRLQRARDGWPPPDIIQGKEINQAVAGWRQYPGAQAYVPFAPKQIAGIELRSDRMVQLGLIDGGLQAGLDNLYLTWCEDQFLGEERPEIFYTLLRGAYEQGLFEHNSVTQQIAGRILEAADYFDMTLSREQNVQNLVRLPGHPSVVKVEPTAAGSPHFPRRDRQLAA